MIDAPVLVKLLDPDVTNGNFHRLIAREAFYLDADQSGLIIRRFWIIVHIHCHQLAVDHVDESVSPRDNMVAAFLHLVSVV